jgi:hypothetical protein
MGPDVPSPFGISDRRACTENEMSEIILPDLPFGIGGTQIPGSLA